ncbi:hypothetical protein ACUODF_58695, partial [Escherichia coli]
VKKVVWLAIQSASQKWTMPLQDWRIIKRLITWWRTGQGSGSLPQILKAAPEGGHKPNALFARFNTLFEKST